jgi:hypothetical protein
LKKLGNKVNERCKSVVASAWLDLLLPERGSGKRHVKAMSSKNAQNKLAYVYILAPSGMNLKKELTLAFDAQAGQI